ncbi:oligopeptide ABC transporter permease OppB [Rhodospirillum rubrum]|uniref:Binding-protein-dependent transport systems inner membrane component n=1 Tax=Rhodospirillum rubrum (strain ATCC 11170 / ATH 1.1.1 / DSM 467 / LMG 4362 / NCIMB 8255 / S1) TaxID=269796 RepID=Q2RWV0_RHORT|nr:oligopeptide ABC transporter permease OppB [Rhodospirillum rubrum]ABC21395.1 Binding-protein-dependent transport systems inner membrane component [Rhodospirillum rubrum ATCC 11170]AEO47075.1 binding-protein dependent transport system inner membrane protein [Rhodospirillum rubrum F11]MBK1664429.1 oligopeptide ABC transporter permease OppB [Rhodospirillum rubrum]MBK1675303.1 oligopeptide ABC transporter permease OppB [Rhodospirillum rubrum]MBK5952988.1 oligopeptide transporter permease [Rhodo
MLRFILKRLMIAVPTLLVIITVAFFMMRIAPGGPFDSERALPPEIEKNILAAYNLDKPLIDQYALYLGGILHGDFGPSFKIRDFSVSELILAGAPASIQLGLAALILALSVGVTLGTLAALHQNEAGDFAVMGVAMVGIVIPNFVMAPLLSLVLGVYWGILPTSGWGDGALRYKILPIFALALPQIAYIARLTRGSMVEVLRSNFVRTARAKGLGERLVVMRHTLKAGLLPVVSYLGPAAAAVTTGSVVVETIFAVPGIGTYFVNAALNRDYPVVMGVVIVYASLIILLNLAVDLLYGLIDPKLRRAR